MARTAITVQEIGAHGGKVEDITWTSADETNNHEFVNTGRELVLVKNGSEGSLDVTVDSVADEYGREGDVTISTGASEESIAGPFPTHLFNQSDGKVHIDLTDDTSLTLAVVRFVV
jgi:3-oxoacyl-ACP reductase-like protein